MSHGVVPRPERLLLGLSMLVLLILVLSGCIQRAGQTPYVELAGFAVLPADTFASGPASGTQLPPEFNGRTLPFDSQPVQGVSAVIPSGTGTYLVMSDNGFGAKNNSPDYHLRWYEVNPDFELGTVEVLSYTELKDPNHLIPWPIQNEETDDRVLTGADFDLESFRRTPEGTFWFGEEFGPFLVHTDANGIVMSEPISTTYPAELAPLAKGHPTVRAPQHPAFFDLPDDETRTALANHPVTRGFEGMAINPAGTYLYPMLEGAMMNAQDQTRVLLQRFDLATEQYTGDYWYYPMSAPDHAIGDMTAINEDEYLVIERDSNQGEEAAFKRIFKVNLKTYDSDRVLQKKLVADLMQINDVNGLTTPEEGAIGFGPIFSFPFVTIESVYPVDAQTLLVINDNNYPFSTGRRPDLQPDNTEFILIRLAAENSLKLTD